MIRASISGGCDSVLHPFDTQVALLREHTGVDSIV